jgi:transcriptional regulator with PAS, ATPase and Fis domain
VDNASNETLLPLAQIVRLHVDRVLAQVNGNKVVAAKILGISRTSLYRMLDDSNREKLNEDLESGAQLTDVQ